jgi:hypothetical protein
VRALPAFGAGGLFVKLDARRLRERWPWIDLAILDRTADCPYTCQDPNLRRGDLARVVLAKAGTQADCPYTCQDHHHALGDRAREGDQEMKAPLEDGADRSG